jgi:hypothetical protein
MTDPTMHDIARRQDESTEAMKRLAQSLDRMSDRIDALPDTIDRIYVRKDVALERAQRVDASLASLAANLREHSTQTQEQFERLAGTTRWVIAAVLIPIVLAIFALLSSRGGIG